MKFLELLKDAWTHSGEITKAAIVVTVGLLIGLVIWLGYGSYLIALLG